MLHSWIHGASADVETLIPTQNPRIALLSDGLPCVGQSYCKLLRGSWQLEQIVAGTLPKIAEEAQFDSGHRNDVPELV